MPGHGVFAFFPEAWPYAHGSFWTAYNFYNVLRRTGFQLNQQEHVFYWPVTLGVALEIVRRRPGLLAILPDELYQQGVRRLEAATEERGADTLIPSELTVVEVMAVKRKSEEAEEAMEGDDKGQK